MGDIAKYFAAFFAGVFVKMVWDRLFGYYCKAVEETWAEPTDNSTMQDGVK